MTQRDTQQTSTTPHRGRGAPSPWVRAAQLIFAVFIVLVGTGLIVIGATGETPPIMIVVGICFYGLAAMLVWAGTGGRVPGVVARHRVLFGVLGWFVVAAAGVVFLTAGIALHDDESPKAIVVGAGLTVAALWGMWQRLTQDPPTGKPRPGRRIRP